MGINTNLQNIETKLTNLKTNLDGYLVNKGAAAGSTLTQSIDNVDTIQTGGGGNPFEAIGYPTTPKYIQDGIDYGVKVKTNWDATQTNLTNKFYSDSNLMFMPMVDTSQVTNMEGMFWGCSNLTTIPQLDTSQVTNMKYIFNGCSSLTTIPQLDTSQVTNMEYIFNGCSSLTTIPLLDTSKVTGMSNMFSYCDQLTTVEKIDVQSVSDNYNIFNGWGSDKYYFLNILNIGTVESLTSWDFSHCDWGNESALAGAKQSLIDSLITNSFDRATAGYAPCTLKLSAQTKGYLTEEEKAAITAKGFTIA